MANNIKDISPNKIARIAGLFYLINIITGLFSELFVCSNIIIWENATTTVQNIITSQLLFLTSIISDLLMAASFFLMALTLYMLLKQVKKMLPWQCYCLT